LPRRRSPRVAARLREERQRQGVSLESLASAARVSSNAIIRFETGKTSIQLDTLTRLVVRGLGLDWGSFMASTGPLPRPPHCDSIEESPSI
jgi:transcriptional regulator with XRE-family HTH domain